MTRVMLLVISVLLSAAVPAQAEEFLRKTGRVHVPSIPKFVAADFFVVNHPLLGRAPGIVKIGNLSNQGMPTDNFERVFLGTTETDAGATNLSGYIVLKGGADSVLRSMIDDWGPLGLWDVYAVLARQPSGEPGLLLTDGRANWFHVNEYRGSKYPLVWTLCVRWRDGSGWEGHGWSVTAVSTGPYYLHRGTQIISLSDPLETR